MSVMNRPAHAHTSAPLPRAIALLPATLVMVLGASCAQSSSNAGDFSGSDDGSDGGTSAASGRSMGTGAGSSSGAGSGSGATGTAGDDSGTGSTGEPTIWPRALVDEIAVCARFEQVFRAFGADTRRTLAVVAFPLGTWVGGVFTTACCRLLASKGLPVTVLSTGNVTSEILRVVPSLAPSFEQLVLLGYPPYLKSVIDEGIARGVRWKDHDVKLVLAGEVVTEDWRELIARRAGIRRPLHGVASLYGTADAGVLGNETPLSVAIRRGLGMEAANGTAAPATGSLVRSWRAARGKSQLDLALEAGVSTRHLSAASANASAIADDCVTTRRVRRRWRSASTPTRVARKKTGACWQKVAIPSQSAEPVRRYTSHVCATDCVQVPTSDTS